MLQIYDPHKFDFHEQLVENYGGIVKVNGLFGVRVLPPSQFQVTELGRFV